MSIEKELYSIYIILSHIAQTYSTPFIMTRTLRPYQQPPS